jgi:plasmid stability protein
MTTITIRNVDETVKRKIKIIAANNGRSMEAELHEILKRATAAPLPNSNPLLAIHRRFKALGGVDLDIPPRTISENIAVFEE